MPGSPRSSWNTTSEKFPSFLGLVLLQLLLAPTGCSRFEPPSIPVVDVGSVPDGGGLGSSGLAQISHPRFGGVEDLVAGDGSIRIGWSAAVDDNSDTAQFEYLVYISPDSIPIDLDNPTFVIEGSTSLQVDGLTNGELLRVLVRARNVDQEIDPNKNEWLVTPNPVRLVRSGATAAGADGLTADTAFPSLAQAVASSIPLGGVNLYVTEGLYPENVFLFSGMMLFGGFGDDFSLEERDPDAFLTQFGIAFPNDLVTLRPGDLLTGIDGVSLSGNGIAETCVFADDCVARVTRCRMSGANTQGMDLRSDYLEGEEIRILIADCVVSDCNGEGIRIQGIPQIRIDNCEIRNNLNEGIESQWIHASADKEARIDITRCKILNNGDEGIDLDIAGIESLDSIAQEGARVRVKIRNCLIEENALEGIVIDLDTLDSQQMDIRVRIDDCRIRDNGMAGVFLDGDSSAALRVARCQVTANGGDGILTTGRANGPIHLIEHCNLLGNGGAGLATFDLGSISAWHCWIEGNGQGISRSPRGSIQIQDSILSSDGTAVEPDDFHYCLLDGEWLAADTLDHLSSGALEVVSRPIQFTRGSVQLDGSILLVDSGSIITGDTIEITDDGILRHVISSSGAMITVDPAPTNPSPTTAIFLWPSGSGPIEDPTPLSGSLLIDGSDPAQLDEDGTPHDLGPLGANPLQFIGPDPALADPPDRTQLRWISPAPSMPSISGQWTLSFTRDLPRSILDAVSIEVAGIDRTSDLIGAIDGTDLHLQFDDAMTPGDQVHLEILPFAGDLPGNRLLRRLIFRQRVALVVDEIDTDDLNDSPSTAPEIIEEPVLLRGTISSSSDEDWLLWTPPGSGPYQIELLARREESPLVGRIEIYSGDGNTLIGTSQATAPFYFDPFLDDVEVEEGQSILLKVSGTTLPTTPDAPYRLVLHRSGS